MSIQIIVRPSLQDFHHVQNSSKQNHQNVWKTFEPKPRIRSKIKNASGLHPANSSSNMYKKNIQNLSMELLSKHKEYMTQMPKLQKIQKKSGPIPEKRSQTGLLYPTKGF